MPITVIFQKYIYVNNMEWIFKNKRELLQTSEHIHLMPYSLHDQKSVDNINSGNKHLTPKQRYTLIQYQMYTRSNKPHTLHSGLDERSPWIIY